MAAATASTRAFGASALQSASQNKAAFTGIGLVAVAMGAALAFGLKSAADAAIEFESNLTKMRTLVGLTKEDTDKMGAAMLKLGSTGVGPIELSDALFFITSAGQRGSLALSTLTAAAKASAIGLGDTKTIADAATSAMNAYGSENLSAARATDILAAGIREGKLETASLTPVLGKLVSTSSALGISFEDVIGTMAVLSRTGVDAAEGSTQLSAVMSALLSTSPKVTEALASVGLNMEQLRQIASKDGLIAVMRLLDEAFAGNVEAMRAVFPNVRAFRAVMNGLAQDGAAVDGVLRGVNDSAGIVADGFEEWSNTAEGARARFSASMEGMKVALGSILLPAFSKAMEIGVAFASFITSLPGPLKVAAVALAAAAAALLLIAGAALLILPRIAAVKTAMTTLNLSVAGAARVAFNPWVLAVTAATVGLGIWMSKQAEAKRRVEELTAAIEADSGALGENTRAHVANRLEKEGVLAAAKRLGIELDVLTDAFLGDADAQAVLARTAIGNVANFAAMEEAANRVHGPMNQQIEDIRQVRDAYLGLNPELKAAQEAADLKAEATKKDSDALDEQADAALGAADATGEYGEAAEEATSLTEEFTNALEELAGVEMDVEKAAIAWGDALADTTKELREGSRTLNINTQAGRDNRSAILGALDAAIEHGAAVAEETGSLEAGSRAVQKHIRALIEEAEKAGFSKKEIREYIAQLNLTPNNIKTEIRALVAAAMNDIDNYKNRLAGVPRFITTRIQVLETGSGLPHGGIQHAGGIVGATHARRLHAGGRLRGDEEMFIGQRGEQVLSLAQMRMLRSFTGAGAGSPGGGRGGTAVVVNLNVNGSLFGASKRELAALIADDVQAALLQKQRGSALGFRAS